jgi:addiction module HigA family antidote
VAVRGVRVGPVSPGELLREELLVPLQRSPRWLARQIGVSPRRARKLIDGRRRVTLELDRRLCACFGLSDGYWLRAQAAHDTEVAAARLGSELAKIRPWQGSAA